MSSFEFAVYDYNVYFRLYFVENVDMCIFSLYFLVSLNAHAFTLKGLVCFWPFWHPFKFAENYMVSVA